MNVSFLSFYILHGSGIGGGGRQEARAIAEFRFLRRSELRSCLLGLDGTKKKKKNWPGGDDKFINMTIFGVPFFCAVVESVLEGSNGWQQLRRLKKLTLRVTVLKRTERK